MLPTFVQTYKAANSGVSRVFQSWWMPVPIKSAGKVVALSKKAETI